MHHSAIHAAHLAHAIERGGDGVMGGSSACNTGEHWQEVDAADPTEEMATMREASVTHPCGRQRCCLLIIVFVSYSGGLLFHIAVQIGASARDGRWQCYSC